MYARIPYEPSTEGHQVTRELFSRQPQGYIGAPVMDDYFARMGIDSTTDPIILNGSTMDRLNRPTIDRYLMNPLGGLPTDEKAKMAKIANVLYQSRD